MPEVPARLQADSASFVFRNTFLDTLLLTDYTKGEASFRSDSLTTLAIVKEVVTKEATARKIQIQISVDPKEESVTNLLRKVDPMLQYARMPLPPSPRGFPRTHGLRVLGGGRYQLNLARRVKLIETLKEVRMQEPDTDFLAPEYKEILENEDTIKRELKEQPGRLQFLHGIVVDLFVDNAKFKGQNVTQQVPQLQRILGDYSLDSLIGFFNR